MAGIGAPIIIPWAGMPGQYISWAAALLPWAEFSCPVGPIQQLHDSSAHAHKIHVKFHGPSPSIPC